MCCISYCSLTNKLSTFSQHYQQHYQCKLQFSQSEEWLNNSFTASKYTTLFIYRGQTAIVSPHLVLFTSNIILEINFPRPTVF